MLESFKEQLKNKGEVYLRIKVHPGSARSEIKEVMTDETIKINIAAAPVKGKANIELIKFLSQEFGVIKDRVKIISGAGEKLKLVKITKH